MAEIVLVRQPDIELTENDKAAARRVVFGIVDGMGEQHQRRWRRLWNRLMRLEPGEMMTFISHLARSGPFHRRHMLIEQRVFEAQERFDDFEIYRYWLKVGAQWVVWVPGPTGGVVPVPRSVSYAKADEHEFQEFHAKTMVFLRGPHAAGYLWPHLSPMAAAEMMETILESFDE